MLNCDNRSDALTIVCDKLAALRAYQETARGTFGPVREAWQAKIDRAREQVRLAIFTIRANDYEGVWA